MSYVRHKMAKEKLYEKIGAKTKKEELQELVPKMREMGFYKSKKQRKIDWSSYTLNQINDIIDTLTFIREEVDKISIPEKKKKAGRPPTNPHVLAKAILLIELLGLPERKAEGWMLLLGHHIRIYERLDDRVIGKGYKNATVIHILRQVFENNISTDGEMGGDGTGLETSRKQNYESTKKKKKGKYMTSIVDSREIVQSFDTSGMQECRVMHHLVKKVKIHLKKCVSMVLKKAKLTLDAGFVDKKLAQLIDDSGMTPYIFPKCNCNMKQDGCPGWKKMLLKILDGVQVWLREYHIRSHTESFHSSFKRTFGIVTKIIDETVYTQVLCRIIHNNRRKTDYFVMAHLN